MEVHGSISDGELASLGLTGSEVVDFSHNGNPFGPLPSVLKAARSADLTRYPDPEATDLRRAIASAEGVAEDAVLCGNGSNELIWLAALAFLEQDAPAAVAGPTYGEYRRACAMVGARVHPVDASAPGFQPRADDLATAVARSRARVAFLCNPNNPTGAYVEPEAVLRLCDAAPDTLIVVDEAYLPFTDGRASASILQTKQGTWPENLLILRSLTKDHALAGLRLGYALGAPAVIGALRALRPHWNVNAVALAAGLQAVNAGSELADSLAATRAASADLAAKLRELGLSVVPSSTHFFLLEVGDARAFRSALLREGCVVRDASSFGLPEYVRVAARTPTECERLVAAVARVLHRGAPVDRA